MDDIINVMVNAAAGNMGRLVADRVTREPRMRLVPISLETGKVAENFIDFNGTRVELVKSGLARNVLERVRERYDNLVIAAYPKDMRDIDGSGKKQNVAIAESMVLYDAAGIPFVMGGTGGPLANVDIFHVYSANMAGPVVGILDAVQAMSLLKENSELLRECYLEITESHQEFKGLDKSGTAMTMAGYLRNMGLQFQDEQMKCIRDPALQRAMGVQEKFLGGHGWHFYTLYPWNADGRNGTAKLARTLLDFIKHSPVFEGYQIIQPESSIHTTIIDRLSPDNESSFTRVSFDTETGKLHFRHDINGRGAYVDGTMPAIRFTAQGFAEGKTGRRGMNHVYGLTSG